MKELFGRCQYLDARHVLTGKWSIYIIYLLSGSPLRFNEMLRMMPDNMTPTSLSNQLKALEEQHLVIRSEYPGTPSRVEYSLTDTAKEFGSAMTEIRNWGIVYIEAIRDVKWPKQGDKSIDEMLELHMRDVIQLANKVLTGRWTMNIMYSLEKGSLRFNEIHQKLMGKLTPTTLSNNLRFLESECMIKRTIYDDMPIRVEYTQTPVGASFKNVLNAIADWCEYHQSHQHSDK